MGIGTPEVRDREMTVVRGIYYHKRMGHDDRRHDHDTRDEVMG